MRDLKKLPKIELHCHLDGSIRPSTILDLLKKEGIKVPAESTEAFKPYVSISNDSNSLIDYLEKFNYPIKILQREDNIERVTYELLEDLYKDSVKYVEIRFAPSHHTKKDLSLEQVIEASLRGLEKGQKDFPIKANLIVSLMRHLPVEENIQVINVAKKYLNKGVVACDLAGNEADFPPHLHKKAFDLAKDYGFEITVHAGETGIYQNIKDSVNLLHASRIGHGLSAINSEQTMALLKEKDICLEVCPTSNLDTKAVDALVHHPILALLNKNIKVTLNTDNITVSDITLTEEIRNLIKALNLEMDQYKTLYTNAVNSAFISNEEKIELLKYIKRA